ncbi:MAG: glycosyl hydrolase family 18 protein [Patescibacteria group bacterium]
MSVIISHIQMYRRVTFFVIGILFGVLLLWTLRSFEPVKTFNDNNLLTKLQLERPMVMGFLPFWQIEKNASYYTKYTNTISYFSLTLSGEGKIVRYTDDNETESEPGWNNLKTEKVKKLLGELEKSKVKTSLVVFCGDEEDISMMMDNPTESAKNLLNDVYPILASYGFDDLNIDIESVTVVPKEEQEKFTLFMKTVKSELGRRNKNITLSIDVSPTALIKTYQINVKDIDPYVDKVIFMTYDYHYQNSYVSGSVSPVNGAGKTLEFDVETAIAEAVKIMKKDKIIMGVPLYGYEWESLEDKPSAAVIPGTA